MEPVPDLVATPPPSRRTWLVATGIATAAVVALLVLSSGGGDGAPDAGDTTTTTAGDAAGTTADPGVPGTVPPAGDPGGDTTVVPGTDPATVEPWLPGLMLVWDGGETVATWAHASGGDHFTYRYAWESADDTGGDFGTLPAGTLSYRNDAACGATITFEVLAWTASDVELGRGSASTVSAACVPAAVLPSNLRGEATATGATFRWDPGTGFDTAYQAIITDAAGGGVVSGGLGTATSKPVDAFCASEVVFTLIATDPGSGVEAGRWSAIVGTPPCPGTFTADGASTDVPAGSSGGTVIACPGGAAVIGGGFSAGINVALMPYPGWIARSEADGGGWSARLGSPPERTLHIRPTVLCMAHATTETRTATVSVPSDSLRSVVASCPAGRIAVGGGFRLTPYGPKVLVNAPEGTTGWRVTAYNENASAVELRATVVCLEAPHAAIQEVRSSSAIADGSWGSPQVACPAGWTMMGGGWVTADISVESAAHQGSGRSWGVWGHNQQFAAPGPTMSLDAVAVCVRFR